MSGFYFSFGLTVVGMVLYHLSQKSVPAGMNPFLVIILAYAVGIALCVVCAIAYPGKKNLIESVKLSNPVGSLYPGAAAAYIEWAFYWPIEQDGKSAWRPWRLTQPRYRPHSDRHSGFQGSFVMAKCRRTCILHFRISNGDARLVGFRMERNRLGCQPMQARTLALSRNFLETKIKCDA
jgi:hypothetical protein